MVVDQITQIIDVIAEKLGVAVEMVYPMLIKQAQVECGQYHVTLWILGITGLLLILSILALIFLWDDYNEGRCVAIVGVLLVSGVVFVISGVTALCNLQNYLTALHNPDWWAVEYVLKLIK